MPSKAPISHVPLTGRAIPRCSVAAQVALFRPSTFFQLQRGYDSQPLDGEVVLIPTCVSSPTIRSPMRAGMRLPQKPRPATACASRNQD